MNASFNITPTLPGTYLADDGLRYAEARRECALFIGGSAYFPNVIIHQFCIWLLDASRVAPLCNHIFRILLARSKEEMPRINAQPIVAPMKNSHFRRDRGAGQQKAKSMSDDHLAATGVEGAVSCAPSILDAGAGPNPTIITAAFLNESPKALFWWGDFVYSHSKNIAREFNVSTKKFGAFFFSLGAS